MTRQAGTDIQRLPPLTSEERERALAALERIRRRHAELLGARGGRFFPISTEIIRELREERDSDLP